jgi:cyclophilin family peptidyl-prolyl cis-trans isomerase
MLPTVASHAVWQVRMYAARAAGELVDTATLYVLSRDPSDNVRDAAVVALSGLVRPAAAGGAAAIARTAEIDSIFASELSRPDYQLVLDAAKALEGANASPRLGDLLLSTLDRVTAEHRDTSRDPRMELLARIEALSAVGNGNRVRPYLEDFDPAIAERAARVLRSWGVNDVVVAPRRPSPIPISLASLSRLRDARVRIIMAGESAGGSFDVRLFVDEAPATVSRFVTLARRGYYNGLTFHRVATNFVIQGGSPGANEYVGAEVYMRDEVGLRSHERRTLGISTRGRDTGDAQIFVNLIDNWRLDHDYTVFGEIVRGMEVAAAVLEGDVIARIEILGER